ncbi:hypothetical protein CRE_02405 [Caenorhabditis remanei]|uniref:Lysophospholipid acyltransferase 5 n=1 Tax=Caenorhabditis remanei TaxID=31234 RepID=E3MIM7_CAERE|nr:hypothetical protein CRE_02405 [Caenorhabditis remanei]
MSFASFFSFRLFKQLLVEDKFPELISYRLGETTGGKSETICSPSTISPSRRHSSSGKLLVIPAPSSADRNGQRRWKYSVSNHVATGSGYDGLSHRTTFAHRMLKLCNKPKKEVQRKGNGSSQMLHHHYQFVPSIGRFLAGCTYMVLHQWGQFWIPDPWFNSQSFNSLSFFWRWSWVTLWFRLTIYKYCAMWLITEGASILSGLGHNGKDQDGNDRFKTNKKRFKKWDGVRDLQIIKWETGHDYNSVVESFNCGTNTFAKNHIHRRLRWLNNKLASHVITLTYLAIWHGYHLGYFLLFGIELGCVQAQNQLYALIKRTPGWTEAISQPIARPFIWLFGKITISYSMGFAFLMFGLIKTKYWIGVSSFGFWSTLMSSRSSRSRLERLDGFWSLLELSRDVRNYAKPSEGFWSLLKTSTSLKSSRSRLEPSEDFWSDLEHFDVI